MATTKKTSPKASAKLSSTARATPRETLASVETGRKQIENAVKAGNETVREFISSGAHEAQKTQEKVFAFTRENAETITRSTSAATRGLQEMVALSRENIDALVESGNITADMAKTFSAEIFNYANEAFAHNVELSKEAFGCRTINDIFELQSKLVRANLDSIFNETAKFSNLFFEYAVEAAEPFAGRISETTGRLSKALSA